VQTNHRSTVRRRPSLPIRLEDRWEDASPDAQSSDEKARRERFLSAETHAEQLTIDITRALRAGEFGQALALAERRCRIKPEADATHFLLRASARFHLAMFDLGMQDVRTALQIEPENIVGNRALLASDHEVERLRAARVLLRTPIRDFDVVTASIAALEPLGFQCIGALEATATGIHGWITWSGTAALDLELHYAERIHSIQLEREHSHNFASLLGSAADVYWSWPEDVEAAAITACRLTSWFPEVQFRRPQRLTCSHDCEASTRPNLNRSGAPAVTIIIPVFDDYDATRDCLSVVVENATSDLATIVVVEDKSPDPRVVDLLDTLASRGLIKLLRNEHNLGFAGSVNRALETFATRDVLLLNADTVPPSGFVDRLRRAAYAEADIGTVTPLSNNGEYTSFPVPFRENRMPTTLELVEFDRAAEQANRGRLIDLPNGIGFCMYITEGCLDAVGGFSNRFGRGYFEDVEFCLRAAEAGFRNVCAPDIFVGHHGSKSFKDEKRELVVRNLKKLEHLWPRYRIQSASFVAADPLQEFRAAIERKLLKSYGPVDLLIAGVTTDRHRVDKRVKRLRESGNSVLVATSDLQGGRLRVQLRGADGCHPQGICFDHHLNHAAQEFLTDFKLLDIKRVEFVDLAATHEQIVQVIVALGIPYDIVVAGHAADQNRISARAELLREQLSHPRRTQLPFLFGSSNQGALWNSFAAGVQNLVYDDGEVGATAPVETLCDRRLSVPLPPPVSPTSSTCGTERHLGVVLNGEIDCVNDVVELVRRMRQSDCDLTIFGSSTDDLRIMRAGNAFVAGPFQADEIWALVGHFGISHLFFLENPDRRLLMSDQHALPIALIERNALQRGSRDLAIPQDATMETTADLLTRWMAGACHA
jgi:GT2 family glycosyltransferase